jgi:hypothetical protein
MPSLDLRLGYGVLPMIALPPGASTASQRRADLALKLAQSCPASLADEIALVGSTAHGFADDVSDLELNLWTNAIPPQEGRAAWLLAAGAADLRVEDAPRPDNSYWIGFTLDGIPCEVGWQTFDALQATLKLVRSGTVLDRKVLFLADIIVSALPLRTTGRLAEWQAILRAYSDPLQRSLIDAALQRWSKPGHFAGARRLAKRGERLALMELLLADLDAGLRLLYAAHRRWEPSRKWTLTLAREFAPADLDLLARIDDVLGNPSPEARIDACIRLCLHLLELVPDGFDTSTAVTALQGAR